MFYFLADDDNVILKLCASLKIMETFFFCTFRTIKVRKSFKNHQTATKKKVLQIYKNLLGEKLLGRKKKGYQLE